MTKIGGLMEVILYCQDMNTQVSFYRDKLALDVKEPKGVQDFAGVFWVELETGCCTLALHAGGQRRLGQDAPKIVFRVADVAATRQELARQVAYLKEENRILRARLPERIVATPQEKKRLLRAGRRLGVQLKELMSFVSYQTFRSWIREAEENHTKSKPA